MSECSIRVFTMGNNLFNLILVIFHKYSINTVQNIQIVLLESNDMMLAQCTILLRPYISCLPIMLINYINTFA